MNTFSGMTVEQLRKAGNKVRVIHSRYNANDVKNLSKRKLCLIPAYVMKGEDMNPLGGKTFIQLTSVDGKEYVGVSECSLKDAFNRKRGVEIAIGRLEVL